MDWSSISLCLHVISGFTGLLCGTWALLIRKGSRRKGFLFSVFRWGVLITAISILPLKLQVFTSEIFVILMGLVYLQLNGSIHAGLHKICTGSFRLFQLVLMIHILISIIFILTGMLYFNSAFRFLIILLGLFMLWQNWLDGAYVVFGEKLNIRNTGYRFRRFRAEMIAVVVIFISLHLPFLREIDLIMIMFPLGFVAIYFIRKMIRAHWRPG